MSLLDASEASPFPAIGAIGDDHEGDALAIAEPVPRGRGRGGRGRGRPRRAAAQPPSGSATNNSEEMRAEAVPYGVTHAPGFRFQGSAALLTWHARVSMDSIKLCPWWVGVCKYSWAVERCQDGHLHTHLFAEWESRIDVSDFSVGSVVCWVSVSRGGARPRVTRNRAHYYLSPAKSSAVECESNWSAPEHYVPASSWIIALWRQRKLDNPLDELRKYRLETPHMRGLIETASRNDNIETRLQWRQNRRRLLEDLQRPYHRYTEVESWVASMNEVQPRYKFLWLSGASCLGKSGFAKSLFSRAYVHKDSVDWSGFSPVEHNAVIFDDVHNIEQYVLQHKNLFQASGLNPVNCSATNWRMFIVDTEAVPLIVTTNFPPTDHWVITNCIDVRVFSPMWVEDAPASSSRDAHQPSAVRVHSTI